MGSVFTSVAFPIGLAVIMFGLGLSLTTADFRRVGREPKAVVIALALQILLLPALCFALLKLFDLDPVLAVGMMLLAASPGGTSANLFSHLFRGDVALNISLTAVNSVIAVVTLPVLVNLAVDHFEPTGAGDVGLQFAKTMQVFALVLVPVAVGMVVRRWSEDFASRADRPVRIASVVLLVVVVTAAIVAERERLADYLADVGPVAVAFCACSLTLGYVVPHALGVSHKQAMASAFEVGIHNSVLAITIAVTVLDNEVLAVPGAIYGVLMFPLATIAGLVLTRLTARAQQTSVAGSA